MSDTGFDPADMEALIAAPAPRAVAVLLMAGTSYYQRDHSLMSDDQFDRLLDAVGKNWASVESHQHARLLASKADFEAGTLYRLNWVPNRVLSAVDRMIANETNKEPLQ